LVLTIHFAIFRTNTRVRLLENARNKHEKMDGLSIDQSARRFVPCAAEKRNNISDKFSYIIMTSCDTILSCFSEFGVELLIATAIVLIVIAVVVKR
jgi:hypothetical protein